jgi:hypothetical protein
VADGAAYGGTLVGLEPLVSGGVEPHCLVCSWRTCQVRWSRARSIPSIRFSRQWRRKRSRSGMGSAESAARSCS